MYTPPILINEHERLQDLYEYNILDTHAESDFDELVELASHICKCPISLIALLDKDRQWFKAKIGLEISDMPRDVAFCSYAILQDDVMVVEDTTKDERFCDNPTVIGFPNVRFYAGVPIISPAGHKLGTICIADRKPRVLLSEERRILKLLANQATKLLEIRKKNILIKEKSEEIVRLKTKAISRYMQDTENEKKAIAVYLHEQFAQEIASSLMYLDMVKTEQADKQLEYIQAVEQQLINTLNNIRDLSYKITPLANQLLDTKELISEYVKSVEPTFPFKINLSLPGISNSSDRGILLTVIRMIELWLKVLNDQKSVTEVTIAVAFKPQLIVRIIDNGDTIDDTIKSREVFQHILCDKIYSYGGIINISDNAEKNIFSITLPSQYAEPANR